MKSKVMRAVSVVMCSAMVLGLLSGCEQKSSDEKAKKDVVIKDMEQEEVPVYSFDYIGGNDVMPLLGYFGPYLTMHSYDGNNFPGTLTDEFYQAVADCGINVLSYPQIDYATAPESTMKMLDLADKYGIGQAVFDTNVMNGYDLTKEEVVEYMKEYMTHPAYVGFFLYDEPGNSGYISHRTNYSQLSNLSKILNDDLGMWSYLNLAACDLPDGDPQIYANYVKEYCETQSPKVLSYDHYAQFDPNLAMDESPYLWNMAIIRQYAQEYNLPWWGYIAAGGQWNDAQAYIESTEYYPTESQFNWNVHTNLAFGAKGLSYFILNQPYWFAYAEEEGKYDFERNGIFGAYGNKNQWYYYTQNANKHIEAVDEILMNAVSKGIIISVDEKTYNRDMKYLNEDYLIDTSAFIEGTSWRELEDISGEVLVGCFNYQGKTALYVVNYSWDYAQKIDLSFVKECNVKVIQDAEISYVKGSSMTLDMAAGDGALLVFE